jgi:TonB family protein
MEPESPTPLNAMIASPVMRVFQPNGPIAIAQAEIPMTPHTPVRVTGVIPGMVISRPDPVYPPDAKAAHRQGSVVLHFTVTKAGTVENLTIVSGPEEFRQSAIDAVSEWKYRPYRQNGEPVEKDQTITINFAMDNSSAAVAPGASVLRSQASSATPTSTPAPCNCPPPVQHVQPYTAKQETTRIQTLADGTTVRTVDEVYLARDAEGRTRRETVRTLNGEVIRFIEVFDYPTQTRYTWNVGANYPQVVNVYRPQPNRQAAAAPQPQPPRYLPYRTESLPPQTIDGLYATGTRTTRTTPAGYAGNDHDLVTTTESWYVPSLSLQMRSITDDPRTGKVTTETTDVKQSDPDPALFQPPTGYALHESNP